MRRERKRTAVNGTKTNEQNNNKISIHNAARGGGRGGQKINKENGKTPARARRRRRTARAKQQAVAVVAAAAAVANGHRGGTNLRHGYSVTVQHSPVLVLA